MDECTNAGIISRFYIRNWLTDWCVSQNGGAFLGIPILVLTSPSRYQYLEYWDRTTERKKTDTENQDGGEREAGRESVIGSAFKSLNHHSKLA